MERTKRKKQEKDVKKGRAEGKKMANIEEEEPQDRRKERKKKGLRIKGEIKKKTERTKDRCKGTPKRKTEKKDNHETCGFFKVRIPSFSHDVSIGVTYTT